MEAKELTAELGKRLGIELEFDADGACSFTADELVVTINYLSELDLLVLTGDLGAPPPERLEVLYRAMLDANHLFVGTAGSTLSRDPQSGNFALCRAFPCRGVDAETFYVQTERFVSTLEAWAKLVANFRDTPQDAVESVPDTIPPFGFMV